MNVAKYPNIVIIAEDATEVVILNYLIHLIKMI